MPWIKLNDGTQMHASLKEGAVITQKDIDALSEIADKFKQQTQRRCECLTYCVEKCKLASNQYCRKDREAMMTARETAGEPRG